MHLLHISKKTIFSFIFVGTLFSFSSNLFAKENPFVANRKAVTEAIKKNDLQTVSSLIPLKVSVDDPAFDGSDSLPLIEAVYLGRDKIAEYLIQCGANVNEKVSGKTVLYKTIKASYHVPKENRADTLKLLIANGVDIEAKCDGQQNALHLACLNGKDYFEIAQALIEAKANIEALSSDDETPLMKACQAYDNIDTVMLLLEQGANINAEDIKGQTPLIKAAISYNDNVAKMLIARNANIEAKDNKYCTALTHAAETGKVKTAEALVNAKANVDVVDSYGTTPLMAAIIAKNLSMVKFLIASKAEVNFRTKRDTYIKISSGLYLPSSYTETVSRGSTALTFSKKYGTEAITEALIAAGAIE